MQTFASPAKDENEMFKRDGREMCFEPTKLYSPCQRIKFLRRCFSLNFRIDEELSGTIQKHQGTSYKIGKRSSDRYNVEARFKGYYISAGQTSQLQV